MTSGPDTARAAHNAGFPDSQLVEAVATAIAESSLTATLTHANSDGSTDYGLWQINSSHNYPELANGAWKDPNVNAQLAYRVWKESGWNAWSVHRISDPSGYLLYQTAIPVAVTYVTVAFGPIVAGKSVLSAPGDVTQSVGGGVSDVLNVAAEIAKEPLTVLKWLEDPDTWIRILKFIIGAGLIYVGVATLINSAANGLVKREENKVADIAGEVK